MKDCCEKCTASGYSGMGHTFRFNAARKGTCINSKCPCHTPVPINASICCSECEYPTTPNSNTPTRSCADCPCHAPHQNEAEWAFRTTHTCESFVDHQPDWCGDCYACRNCGLKFVILKGYVSRTQIAEVVEEMKRPVERALDELGRVKGPTIVMGIAEDKGWNAALEALKAKLINPNKHDMGQP